MIVAACVRCGFCCERGPCQFGFWDKESHRCVYLRYDYDGRARCKRYSEIMENPEQKWSPAFGCGCCMSLFNGKRTIVLKKFHKGRIPTVEIDDFDEG